MLGAALLQSCVLTTTLMLNTWTHDDIRSEDTRKLSMLIVTLVLVKVCVLEIGQFANVNYGSSRSEVSLKQ